MSFFLLSILFLSFIFIEHRCILKTEYYILGMVLGWLIGLISFILYLSGQNYYYNVLSNVFHIQKNIWNYVTRAHLDFSTLVRMLNFGICLLVYSTLAYSLSYSKLFISSVQRYCLKEIFLVFLFLEYLVFDPTFYMSSFFRSLFPAGSLAAITTRGWEPFFRFFNTGSGILALFILIYQYLTVPKLAYFKKLAFYNIIIICALQVMNLLLFFWTPMLLIKASRVKNYYTYIVPDLSQSLLVVGFAPYLVLILLALVLYFSFKYTCVIQENRNIEVNITQNMDTAALGMRTFSHSIKNQLLAIRSETEYLEELTAGNEEAAYSLKLISEACRNAFQCLDNGYDILRGRHIHLKYDSVKQVLEQSIEKASSCSPDISFILECHTGTVSAYIDQEHFQEVFDNLLQNSADAIHSTMDGRKGMVIVALDSQANWLTVSITDNGCGIPKEDCEKIFHPFYSTKASVKNWGMGLSFCQQIINAHSGRITVTSKENAGTTLLVVLPIMK